VRLRNELRQTLQLPATIRWGGLGELSVVVDGRVVFSKSRIGRIPEPGEITRLVQSLL
jgi:hypothetical protein